MKTRIERLVDRILTYYTFIHYSSSEATFEEAWLCLEKVMDNYTEVYNRMVEVILNGEWTAWGGYGGAYKNKGIVFDILEEVKTKDCMFCSMLSTELWDVCELVESKNNKVVC